MSYDDVAIESMEATRSHAQSIYVCKFLIFKERCLELCIFIVQCGKERSVCSILVKGF